MKNIIIKSILLVSMVLMFSCGNSVSSSGEKRYNITVHFYNGKTVKYPNCTETTMYDGRMYFTDSSGIERGIQGGIIEIEIIYGDENQLKQYHTK